MINYDTERIRYRDDTKFVRLKDTLKSAAFWIVSYCMALKAIKQYAFLGHTIILFAIIICALASLLSYFCIPAERPNQIITAKKNLFMYTGALLVVYAIISSLNSIDPNMAGVSLGLSTGQITNNAALGWLQVMIQFIIVGAPITHISYEAKRIITYYGFGYGRVTKRVRAEQLQKNIVPKRR